MGGRSAQGCVFPELEGASGAGGTTDKIFPPERVLMGRNLHTEARFLSTGPEPGGDLSGGAGL